MPGTQHSWLESCIRALRHGALKNLCYPPRFHSPQRISRAPSFQASLVGIPLLGRAAKLSWPRCSELCAAVSQRLKTSLHMSSMTIAHGIELQ